MTTKNISYPTKGISINSKIEKNSFWFRYRNKNVISVIKKYHLGGTFLDIGGGSGTISLKLQDFGIKTILLEPMSEASLEAKEKGVKSIVVDSLENFNLPVQSVGLFDVLEHINKDNEFIKKIHDILHKKGRMFITVPVNRLLWSSEDVFAGHFRRYSFTELKNIIEKNNFKILYNSYLFSFLVVPVFLFRVLPTLFFNKKGGQYETLRDQHKVKSSFNQFLIKIFCKIEFDRISKLKRIPFGTSLLIVAEKK